MTGGRLLIRRYLPGDNERVKTLHYLGLEQFDADPGVVDIHYLDDDLDDIENRYPGNGGEFLVGTYNDRIIAIGGFRKISETCAEIKRMRVHPDYQRRGFGQQILERLLDTASRMGYTELRLDTTAQMVPAQRLYEKNGFKRVRNEKIGRLDVLFYEKSISD